MSVVTVNSRVVPLNTENTLLLVGPVFLGSIAGWFLFGVSVVQLYIYYVTFPSDRKITQYSVYIIFALDTLHSVVITGVAWIPLCAGWGDPAALRHPGFWLGWIPCVSGVVATWVQLFYAWRIHKLGKWKVVPCMVIFLALAQAGAALAVGISSILNDDVANLHNPSMFSRTIIWLGGGALIDVIVTTSMIYLLHAAKKNSIISHRGELTINRLIRLSAETGTATALSALLELILFLALPETDLHLFVAMMLCKVYTNTLMASLNARAVPAQSFGGGTSTLVFRGMEFSAVGTGQRPVDGNGSADGEVLIVGEDIKTPPCSSTVFHVSSSLPAGRQGDVENNSNVENQCIAVYPSGSRRIEIEVLPHVRQ
ncbi:hypothetical protein OF83DRAFT_1175950 [Amylostereum chailletii]|nr:hypothetical protein OF83DRAFT_1175950 [Amylostereum chailletii]